MNQEERQQKIDSIMSRVKKNCVSGKGISIELWIIGENPTHPRFDEWLVCCTEAADDYFAMTGKKDRDSVFAEYVREYGRRERRLQ